MRRACARVVALSKLAERKQETRELRRRQLRQRVRLILCMLVAKEMRAVVAAFDARVVARCDVARAEPIGVLRERPELHEVVASNARIRRSAGGVLIDEPLDDVAPKDFFEVEDVVRDAQRRGARASIVEVVDAATALGVRGSRRRIHFHRDTDDVVTVFDQETGSNRGVDAAAHRRNDAFFSHVTWNRITLGRG